MISSGGRLILPLSVRIAARLRLLLRSLPAMPLAFKCGVWIRAHGLFGTYGTRVGGGLLHLINGVFSGNTSTYYPVPFNSTNAGVPLYCLALWIHGMWIRMTKLEDKLVCLRHPPYRGLCAMDMASILSKSLAGIWDIFVLRWLYNQSGWTL